jgi:pimeloyl-ACP methyl ester carboxylesterase
MWSSQALLRSTPKRAADYAAAEAKFAALHALDGADVRSVCCSTLLTHGTRTPRAYVLLHGLSNCPRQYVEFAPLLFTRGANVLIPRLPHHGGADLSGHELAVLTPEELCRFGDAVIDIAHGLGERVTVVGISGGGVLAAWIAQVRADVERAVLLSPSFGLLPHLPLVNELVNEAATWLVGALPNRMFTRTRGTPGPPHSYRKFASHGVAAMLQQGRAVLYGARHVKPATGSVLVALNENDDGVNNALSFTLVRRWRAHGADAVATYVFSRQLGLIHDVVDPMQPQQQTAVVYPILIDLVTAE